MLSVLGVRQGAAGLMITRRAFYSIKRQFGKSDLLGYQYPIRIREWNNGERK